MLYHQKIISNYVDEEISYGELSIRNSDLIDEIKDLNGENQMLVGLLKTEKEKFKNEMNIQQENLKSELLIAKDLQQNLQGPAQMWDPLDGPSRTVLVGQKNGPYTSRPCPSFCRITRSIRAIFKDENFANIQFSLEERRNHVTLVCQNITYKTTFWEEHNGTNFVDVPSKLGFISVKLSFLLGRTPSPIMTHG